MRKFRRFNLHLTYLVVEPESEYGTLVDVLNECDMVVLKQGGCGGCPQEAVQQHGGQFQRD